MAPNTYGNVNVDPQGSTLLQDALTRAITHSNGNALISKLKGPSKYRSGSEYEKAAKATIGKKLAEVGAGNASTALSSPSKVLWPEDGIDFDAPIGMAATLKEKAKSLPGDVFTGIVGGLSIDRAAIDAWRIYVTAVAEPLTTKMTLSRGLGRSL
ncbi:MAG: hypothetical protein U0R17_03315 [Acidimicrobiia bacterium]